MPCILRLAKFFLQTLHLRLARLCLAPCALQDYTLQALHLAPCKAVPCTLRLARLHLAGLHLAPCKAAPCKPASLAPCKPCTLQALKALFRGGYYFTLVFWWFFLSLEKQTFFKTCFLLNIFCFSFNTLHPNFIQFYSYTYQNIRFERLLKVTKTQFKKHQK